MRNVRREAMDKFKGHEEGRRADRRRPEELEEEVQKLTDKYVKVIDETCAAKNQEIMEV